MCTVYETCLRLEVELVREDPRRVLIGVVLSFLQQGLERRMSPSTLKVHDAVFATYHNQIDGKSVGKYDLIVRFLRGARWLNPHRHPSIPSWDLALVLRDLNILSMKTLLLVALASVKRVGELQAFSVNEWYLEFRPSDHHVVLRPRPGYVPKVPTTPFRDQVVSPRGGRPSPGFALSSSQLATVHWQNTKPQDLRPAFCLLRRPAEGKDYLQAEDGPLDSGRHRLGLPSTRHALAAQVACTLCERCGILLGIGSWHLADIYL